MNRPATMNMLPVGASLLATMLLAMAGCTGLPTEPTTLPPSDSTIAAPLALSASLQLHDGDSRIELRIDRAGPLARLGHRHVIITNAIHGTASFDPANLASAQFNAAFRVETLQVDDPDERAAAGEGFATVPDAAAIAGTRMHMLSALVLDAEKFPQMELRLHQLVPDNTGTDANANANAAGKYLATIAFIVKNAEHALQVPVQVTPLSGGGYTASGVWTVTHAELGLTPYSAAGGLIKVGDPIEVRFRLVAKPL